MLRGVCSVNIKIINKYKDKIRKFMKSQQFAPSPEMVLDYLLKDYIMDIGLPGFQFVKSLTSSHTEFATQLSTALKEGDFNLLKQLDVYLSTNKLKTNGDFFALLLAYFNYYGSQYEFSEFENVKKQIFIPLHVYHQKISTEQVDSYLATLTTLSTFDLKFEDLNSDEQDKYLELEDIKFEDLKLKFSSIRNLGTLSENKLNDVVSHLLDKINRMKRLEYDGGDRYFNFLIHAFDALCAIQIPKKLQTTVVEGILSKSNLDQDDRYDRGGNMRESACKALGIIPVPESKRQIVISRLLGFAGSPSWPLRQKAWEALENIGVSEEDKMEFINKRLRTIKQLGTHPAIISYSNDRYFESDDDKHHRHMFHGAVIELATMGSVSIPEEKKSEIVLAVLEINFRQCPEEYYHLVRYLTPSSLRDLVIDRLLADFMAQRTHRTSDLIEAIEKLSPSGEKLVEVLREFIQYLRLHPGDSFYIFEMLTHTNIPNEIRADARDALIQSITTTHPAYIDNVALALVNVGIPKDQFAQLLSQISNAVLASQYREREPKIYAAFSKADIPAEIRESFINDLIKRIGDYAVDRALGVMDLTHGESHKVINALLKKLAEQEKGDITGIFETLIKLQESMQPHESVAVKIKLEEMFSTTPKDTAYLILPYMKEFDKLCDVKMQLAQKLPPELVERVLKL